jgi:glycerol-3-phosphate acyltransferase PlsY
MEYFVCIVIGYLIGAINPAYLFSKLRGFDIRQRGSGNAGASNVVIVFGKMAGLICALLDIAKVCFVIWLAELIFPNFEQAFVVAGVCCILGHIFPFYMKFRGGKGLACLGGMILMYDWRIFLIMLLSEIVVLILTQYLCFVPITAAVAFVVIYGVINKDILGILLLAVAALVITFKHGKNIARIRMGTEARFFGYLFNKEKEIARLKQNAENE